MSPTGAHAAVGGVGEPARLAQRDRPSPTADEGWSGAARRPRAAVPATPRPWPQRTGRVEPASCRVGRKSGTAVVTPHLTIMPWRSSVRDRHSSACQCRVLTSHRVIDFGIAHAWDGTQLTHAGASLGTPGFIDPEQVRGLPARSPADVFALGGVVAFASTGQPPFGEGPPSRCSTAWCTNRPTWPVCRSSCAISCRRAWPSNRSADPPQRRSSNGVLYLTPSGVLCGRL